MKRHKFNGTPEYVAVLLYSYDNSLMQFQTLKPPMTETVPRKITLCQARKIGCIFLHGSMHMEFSFVYLSTVFLHSWQRRRYRRRFLTLSRKRCHSGLVPAFVVACRFCNDSAALLNTLSM